MKKFSALVLLVTLTACGSSPVAQPEGGSAPDATATSASETPSPPAPNYAEYRKGIYYYIAGVSDNEKADGKAAGEVVGYRYLGKNGDGEFVIAWANMPSMKATCADPCRVIHTTYGKTFEYTPSSVIGSAFSDAMNGYLVPHKGAK